jgi:hypothetical protein
VVLTRTLAPSCVAYSTTSSTRPGFFGSTDYWITVTNRCQEVQRVVSSRRMWFDGGCHTLAPGESYTDWDGRYQFNGVSAC